MKNEEDDDNEELNMQRKSCAQRMSGLRSQFKSQLGYQLKIQLKTGTISLVALSILVSNMVTTQAGSADTESPKTDIEAQPAPRISHDKMILAKAAAGSKDGKPKVINLTLSRMRDTGLAIRQLRQQALNIHLEATRKEMTASDKCAIADPVPDDVDLTKQSCGAYLPPRKEWLVVYLTALEPVSQLLRKWQGNVKAGTVVRTVPKGTAAKFRPINQKFFEEAMNIEKNLDALHDIFESETSDNVKLAEVSKGLLQNAKSLERLREQQFEILKEAALKGITETEVL